MKLFRSKPRSAKATKRSTVLELECLEERQLLTTQLQAQLLAETYRQMTDMAQLAAAQGVQRTTPTILWLNFDGGDVLKVRGAPQGAQDVQTVLAFESTQPDQRDRDIQDIIYRVSEIFAPFNVQVMRAYNQPGSSGGWFDASSNGNTTIFIGDMVGADGSFTPPAFTDHPSQFSDITHMINSNPFDLAFVDSNGTNGNYSLADISATIAHEAGHTFGLWHVHSAASPSNGFVDNNDVMSYDRSNRLFANVPNPLTDDNVGGTGGVSPGFHPVWSFSIPYADFVGLSFPTAEPIYEYGEVSGVVRLETQNSFQFLLNVLGPRPADSAARVADRTAVDGAYIDGATAPVFMGSQKTGFTSNFGDYNVFNLNAQTNDEMIILASPIGFYPGSGTVLLIYDVNGQILQVYRAGYIGNAMYVVFQPAAGQSYKLVVGWQDGGAQGFYRLTIEPNDIRTTGATNGLHTDPADYSKTALYVQGTAGADQIVLSPANKNGAVKVMVNGVNRGVFNPTGHIYVYGKGGNDVIRMVSRTINGILVRVAVPTVVDAGSGNDLVHMDGSKANNVLLGGAGRDDVTGGRGRDLIIGGRGADALRGGRGGDLLIGNRTAFDADQNSLVALMAEWGRNDVSYQTLHAALPRDGAKKRESRWKERTKEAVARGPKGGRRSRVRDWMSRCARMP